MCDRFLALTPLSLRKERARDVFKLIVKYNIYAKKHKENDESQKKKKQSNIIRRPAGDTWF